MNADFYTDPLAAPAAGGAYVLLICLRKPMSVQLARRPPLLFGSGRYLYCGSAYGPGGLRARLRRHMQRRKTVHWHVDHLTGLGRAVGAWAFPGADECQLVERLRLLPVPHPGFGASDCDAGCASHLLAWPPGVAIDLP